MANETKHVAMNAKQQAELRKVVNAICKEHGTGVRADLDSRMSYRDKDPNDPEAAVWQAYSRFLLDDGHTIFVNLRTMNASYSKDVNKYAQGKVERKLAKAAKTAERKAAREAKAQAKAAKKADTVTVKAPAVKAPKPKGVPRVKFDPSLSTLDADDHTTAAAPKAKRVRKPKAAGDVVKV